MRSPLVISSPPGNRTLSVWDSSTRMPPAVRLVTARCSSRCFPLTSGRFLRHPPARSWCLPHYLGGILVVPQALEPRVAQLPLGRPLAEANLGDQAGLDPVHSRPRQAAAGGGGVVPLPAGQPRRANFQGPLGEPCAQLIRVNR